MRASWAATFCLKKAQLCTERCSNKGLILPRYIDWNLNPSVSPSCHVQPWKQLCHPKYKMNSIVISQLITMIEEQEGKLFTHFTPSNIHYWSCHGRLSYEDRVAGILNLPAFDMVVPAAGNQKVVLGTEHHASYWVKWFLRHFKILHGVIFIAAQRSSTGKFWEHAGHVSLLGANPVELKL